MQTERQQRLRAGIPRCRMLLRTDLGWLPGFPVGQGGGCVSWMAAGRPGDRGAERVELTQEHLSRAARTWAVLMRRFPRALPRVVDGLDRWKEGVPRILECLGNALRHGEPLAASLGSGRALPQGSAAQVDALAGQRPTLRPLLEALSWNTCLAPSELPPALEWIGAHRRRIEGILERQAGPGGIAGILTLYSLVRQHGDDLVAPLLNCVSGPAFADWIVPENQETRRRALELCRLTLTDPGGREEPGGDLAACVREAVAPRNAAFYRETVRILQRLPVAASLSRLSFLAHWVAQLRRHHARVVPLLRELGTDVVRWPDLAPALALLEEEVVGLLLAEFPERRHWPTMLKALAATRASRRRKLSREEVDRIFRLALVTRDAERASECFRRLAEAGWEERAFIHTDVLRVASGLDCDDEHFKRATRLLQDKYSDDPDVRRYAGAVESCLAGTGWAGVAGGMIADDNTALLSDVGRRLLVARALRGGTGPGRARAGEVSDWAQRYPEALHPVLGRLACAADDARRVADGVLAKDFSDPEALLREIEALEQRLRTQPSHANLEERLRNLQARLRNPRPVSPARIDRLRRKLESAVRRSLMETWRRRLDAELDVGFSRLLDVDAVPQWMFEPQQLRVLAGMRKLPRAFRDLGRRLLRRRAGPPPWNLDDDPANREFLARLQGMGVDVAAWLDPPSQVRTGDNGRTVRFVFERDPLEILQMGWHFGTCLSPGSFNFFSALAVAADINKHVVYARDMGRRVVGRCLLALDGEGRLLVFYPYCHDPGLGFGSLMGELAEELALRMNTVVVHEGEVPCLVAPRWYDDGPTDLCNRFAALQSLEGALSAVDLDDVVDVASAAFRPLPLNSLTLPLLLRLPVFEGRPELIRPLFPVLEKCEGLDDRSWIRAVRIAEWAGATHFARHALREHGPGYLLRTRDRDAMALFVELDPAGALRCLRRMRHRSSWRHPFIASALRKLVRPVPPRRTQGIEWQALVELCEATQGVGWHFRTNWNTSAPLGKWYGVKTRGRVTELQLAQNRLAGPIPEALGNLTRLADLDLSRNDLNGSIPASLGRLTRLTRLSLAENGLTGRIPDALGGLSNLAELDLSGNGLTGPVPEWLGDLTNMRKLSLRGNQLTGPIPDALGNLRNLTELDLSDNQLTGPIPSGLGRLTALTCLRLSRNQLTGPIPYGLGRLKRLTELDLSGKFGTKHYQRGSVGLTGTVPDTLGSLKNLTRLSLHGQHLTGSVPDALGDLTALEELDLSANGLTSIPEALANLASLKRLDLSGNRLGSIPDALGNLSNLTELDLSGNELTGSVPDAVSGLTGLTRLDLSSNRLTSIPDSFWNLKKVAQLSLAGNELTGPVPAKLVSLWHLVDLNLSGNAFTGRIPAGLLRLAESRKLRLSLTSRFE